MSALLDRPKASSRKGQGSIVAASALPQVNLLPAEVRAARGLRQIKRYLLLGVAATVVVAVAGYGVAVLDVNSANSELDAANQRTTQLQAEQAKYKEVPVVRAQLSDALLARSVGMSTDIEYARYLGAISAVLPDDIALESLVVTGPTPMVTPQQSGDPLAAPSVGSIQFTGKSVTVPDTAALIDELNGLEGFADAWVTSTQITGDEDSGDYYTVTASVQLTDVAAKLRVDVSVASRQVSALVDAGLVLRTVDDDDRRVRYLALTDAGREFAEASFRRIDDLVSEAFSDWSDEDLAEATSRIRSVAAALTTTHDRAQAQEEIPAR